MKLFKQLFILIGCSLLLSSCGYKESSYEEFKAATKEISTIAPSKLEVKGKLYNQDYDFVFDATKLSNILYVSTSELIVYSLATSSPVTLSLLIEDSNTTYYLKNNGFKTVRMDDDSKEITEWNNYGHIISYVNTDVTNPSNISFDWTYPETK